MKALGVDVSGGDVEQVIRNFIQENFVLAAGTTTNPGADDSLTEMGLVDSTGVLELIAFIEDSFSISVTDEETVPENLDTIGKIVAFVTRKQAA